MDDRYSVLYVLRCIGEASVCLQVKNVLREMSCWICDKMKNCQVVLSSDDDMELWRCKLGFVSVARATSGSNQTPRLMKT
jgi:hypothetical protein